LNSIRIEAIKGGISEFNMSCVSVGKILYFHSLVLLVSPIEEGVMGGMFIQKLPKPIESTNRRK
jgi:hypothetical protein